MRLFGMDKFACSVGLVCLMFTVCGTNGVGHNFDNFQDSFVCHENPEANTVKFCQWKDSVLEEAMVEVLASSSPGRCPSPNEPCVYISSIEYAMDAVVRPEFHLDKETILALQPQIDPQFTATTGIKTQIPCKIEPGNQAEVWLQAKIRRFKGNLAYRESQRGASLETGAPVTDYTYGSGVVRVDSPVRDLGPGSLDCLIECRQKPLADTTKLVLLVNTRKMTAPDGNEAKAARMAIKQVVDSLPPKNEGLAKTFTFNGIQAWAAGHCNNMNENRTYHALCRACLNYLADNILPRSGYAFGARWLTRDCGLRYEFYEIDAFSLDSLDDVSRDDL